MAADISWVVIAVNFIIPVLAGSTVVLGYLLWKALQTIPTPDELMAIGRQLINEKIKEFGFGEPGSGGRPPEGLMAFLNNTPIGQGIQKYVLEAINKGQEGRGYYGP